MVFSSVVFLFYFLPAVLILYFTVGRFNIWIRNIILLIASFVFYAWGEPVNVILFAFSCLMNYVFGLLVGAFKKNKKAKKAALILAVIMNIGILFIFKYLNFTIGNVNMILGTQLPQFSSLILPIGISFYTFQAMSYVIDVYREDTPVQKNFLLVALYISLFPQLVAGPIVRYHTVQEQMLERRENFELFSSGVCRFIEGLAKKLILANTFAVIADNVYNVTEIGHTQYLVPVTLAWVGAFAYALQIFFDFSAYSDMAIGLGRMFGFKFEENFNYPYIARSMNDFWKRWHISLTSWFREYVYFPLGGSRTKNWDGLLRNLMIVWLLTGIWHGANWTFILWGIWNLIFIAAERFLMLEKRKISSVFRHIYTLLVICIGWVLFRSENLTMAMEYIRNMFGLNGNGFFSDLAVMFCRESWLFILVGIAACLPLEIYKKKAVRIFGEKPSAAIRRAGNIIFPVFMSGLFVICIIYVVRSGYNPFIYFNF